MTTYEAGTVAVATVLGIKGVRVMRTTGTGGADQMWLSDRLLAGTRVHREGRVTDVRPLAVLDPTVWNSNRPIQEWLRDAVHLLRRDHQNAVASVVEGLTEWIEAQTKPPRIPEPGLWGVVEADANPEWRGQLSGVKRWVHIEAGWCSSDDVDTVPWATLIDPTLVRDGIDS